MWSTEPEQILRRRRELLQLGATLALTPYAEAGAAQAPQAPQAPKTGGMTSGPQTRAVPAGLTPPALRAFENVVGAQWVFTEPADLDLYRDYYSPFWGEAEERVCSGAIAPDSVEQVQAIARVANDHGVPLYPISTGRNLGYGGSAPALSGSVVLDLKRMNRIIEVNERNAFALVEPGVSYLDLANYIREHRLKLWLDAPEPGWGSPIGNTLDHGSGFTRVDFRNHFEAHCGMEVVLANGDLVRTGMGAIPGAQSWQHYKYAVGPALDGLFLQSNFGIVTKMGFWLMPEPEAMMSGEICVPRYRDIIPLVDAVTRLENGRIFNGLPEFGSPLLGVKIGQGPGNAPPMHPEVQALLARSSDPDVKKLEEIGARIKSPYWASRVTFYGPLEVIEAQWRHVKQVCSVIEGAWFNDGVRRRFPLSDAETEQLTSIELIAVGKATMKGFDIGPLSDQGAVGHIFTSAVIPRTGEAVLEANEVFRQAAKELGLPVQPIYWPTAYLERSFRMMHAFPVTRDPAVNRKMRAAAHALIARAAEHGWGECRSSPAFYDEVMASYSFNDHALRRLCETLKDAIDPNGILAAGRYGVWPAHLRASR